jgi:hypothetical protein
MRTTNKQLHYGGLGSRILGLALVLIVIGIATGRANTVIWSEGFEGYNTDAGLDYGGLDKNASGGANAAPNGSGNPWFGPNPNNAWVTRTMTNPDPTNVVVTPHAGQFMIRGNRNASGWYNDWDNDIDHENVAYRFNGGAPFKGNFAVDWWFYDALGSAYPGDINLGPGCFGDHAGIEYNTAAPTSTDYSNNGNIGTPATGTVTARLGLGAYEAAVGYDVMVYQAHVLGAADGQFGDSVNTYNWGTGWFNTSVTRTSGWHHAAITVDNNNMAVLSIDNIVVLTHATGATNGFNVFTTTEIMTTPHTYNQSAYYDDITLSLITGPKIVNSSMNGSNLTITATDGMLGWTYNVVTSTSVTQPLGQWTAISTNRLSANGSFTVTATNAVSAANSKAFFALWGAIVQP